MTLFNSVNACVLDRKLNDRIIAFLSNCFRSANCSFGRSDRFDRSELQLCRVNRWPRGPVQITCCDIDLAPQYWPIFFGVRDRAFHIAFGYRFCSVVTAFCRIEYHRRIRHERSCVLRLGRAAKVCGSCSSSQSRENAWNDIY